ncbi:MULTISPECIES: N-6 DNA methylase [unclassified Pseudoalteromonas]|uniref:N-6 DNA methylase n=1 Tax=unclassified Pseudoalteromonas TaxID=194690 RepID=UPI0005A814C9|nr:MULTISPECIES: N-6 DNA methylase [unclassified Pseudoalteromonas]
MENLQKQLWNAMEQCRGSMEVSHLIELFSHVAFIAKEAPDSFQIIVNSGQAKQLDALTNAGQSLENVHPDRICAAPEHYKIDTKVVSVAIQLIAEVTNFKLLAKLLREFTKAAGKKRGELSSNLNMERVFTSLIGDCSSKSLYDGACGLARIASELNAEMLFLEERCYTTWVTAYRLLTLEDKQFELKYGDSLFNSSYNHEKKFDLVVMEPPFSLRFGADERRLLTELPFIEVPTGKVASANSGDSLWLQQALSNLNEEGLGYILLPQGVLFRGGYDAKVRDYLLNNELLEAVIGLPASILDFSGISPVLLILNKNKSAGSPVVFVDASEIGTASRVGVEISEDDANLIANLVSGKLADDQRYKAVFIPEIRDQNNELNISKYIIKNIEVEEFDITEELKKLNSCQANFEQSQQKLTSLLNKFQ